MSRKAQKKYGPGGQYYRKRIRRPDGKYEDVYAKTTAELSEKVTVRQAQLAAEAAAAAGAPKDPYFYEYAAAWYSRVKGNYRPKYRAMVENQINKVICPVIGGKPLREITSDDLAAVLATRQHLSRSSQQKTVLILKQIMDAAYEAGAVDRLPARKLKPGGRLTVAHGMSRERINDHHRGGASHVSRGLMPAEDLATLLAPFVTVDHVVSDETMYLVSGFRCD